MIDYSKLSTEDLIALQNDDLNSVSTAGLQYLQSALSEQPEPEPPGFWGAFQHAAKKSTSAVIPAIKTALGDTEAEKQLVEETKLPGSVSFSDIGKSSSLAEGTGKAYEYGKEQFGGLAGSLAVPVAGMTAAALAFPEQIGRAHV